MRGDCTGRISYRAETGEIGREVFSINRRGVGRIVRAYCEMDEKALIRDTSWSLDAAWRPVEGHVRITMGDVVTGSAWYCVGEDGVDCESVTTARGRISQHLPGRPAYLGLHPLIGDGLIAAARGTDAPGTERMIDSVTCSYSPDGETELMALPITIGVTYIGAEDVAVHAGRFAGLHYTLRWQPYWPPAHLWVMADDYIFLRLTWPEVPVINELDSFAWTSPAAAS